MNSRPASAEGQARRPVKPRDAASLVLLRGPGDDPEVLLGRREPRHRFMPNYFVFPGGRLDTTDAGVPCATELRPEVAAKLTRKWPERRARALATAAVRETFEETGLAVGQVEDGELRPALGRLDYVARAITPPVSPIRFHARFFLAEAADDDGELKGNGELLDLQWFRLSDALRLDLIDVTEFVLHEVSRRRQGWQPPGVPLFSYLRGVANVRYE